MRVKFTVAALLAVASAVAFAQQSQNPFVGRWNLRGTGPDTDKVYWLEVTQKGEQLEGRFLNRSAHATPLAWIRVEGKELVSATGVARVCRRVRSLNADRFIARTWRTAS